MDIEIHFSIDSKTIQVYVEFDLTINIDCNCTKKTFQRNLFIVCCVVREESDRLNSEFEQTCFHSSILDH